MRAVVQRVARAEVKVGAETVGAVGRGLLVLVGIAHGDTARDAETLADKLAVVRIFPDEAGKMNRSLMDVDGAALVVSQFTLLGSVRKGRRPSFTGAADPEMAAPLVERVRDRLREQDIHAEAGAFGAYMEVELVNEGPVTFVVEVVDGVIVESG